ncbi:Serine protease [Rhyzopertha dominica]|nr:Serine protease [Rhyzopertha dominica]
MFVTNSLTLLFCLLGFALALPTSKNGAGNDLNVPRISTVNLNDLKPLQDKDDGSRVVGGEDATSGQFPYIVSLRRSNSHFCAGTIVTVLHIITAAHCTQGVTPSAISAVAGSVTLNSGGTAYVLSRITNHPDYEASAGHDISILRTAETMQFDSLVGSLPILAGDMGGGFRVVLSGWGGTYAGSPIPNNLQYIYLSTISNDECNQRVSPNTVEESNICTFTQVGQGACNGDSGGPLVYEDILVGVVSWGYPCAVGYPDVYTRISSVGIQFTMKMETNGALPFLDVMVTRKQDGTLGHRVYRKPTHTDRYLHADSHHHPAQKQGVINTLIQRAKLVSEPDHLEEELEHLRRALQKTGYPMAQIEKAINKQPRRKEPEEHIAAAYLPYVK